MRNWFEVFQQAQDKQTHNYLKLNEYFIHIDSQAFLDLSPPGRLSRWKPRRFCITGNTCYSQTHRIIKTATRYLFRTKEWNPIRG